jgi:hypothetical protein
MKREPLELKHKDLLAPRLSAIKNHVSEYCFPNLYLYRDVHEYEVLVNDEIYIAGLSYDGKRYLIPTRDIKDMDIEKLLEAAKNFDFIYPVPEEWLVFFKGINGVSYTFEEGDSDYLYLSDKMGSYPGRWLHKKRNLKKQFEEAYEHMGLPLTTERLEDAKLILDGWSEVSNQQKNETDYYPCMEALERYDELSLCGGIYYADGEPAGFALGEEVSPETFVLHFSKGLIKFKGIYQYIFSSFANILPSNYMYINIEQDMNNEALRRSKRSYRPDILLKKYRVTAG